MGTEAFWVPAAITALATTGEAVNQSQAAKRQDNAEAGAIQNQQQLRNKANAQVGRFTQQVAQSDPTAIQAKATGDYVSQLRKNAAGTGSVNSGTSALAPVAGASSRYAADTAAGQKEVGSYGNNLADQMGAIDAGVRQRQQEGLGMQTLGTGLNDLNIQSQGQNFVDQLRANTAGIANPWATLGAKLAYTGATTYKPGGKVPDYNTTGGAGVMSDSGLAGGARYG